MPVDGAGRARDSGAQKIVRERPEVAFFPNLAERFVLGKRDRGRDREGVHREEDGGRDQQGERRIQMTFVEQTGVICGAGGSDGDGHASQVEQYLVSLRPLFIVPEALNQGRRAPHE